jgi:outer membrane receptor protein involved in Fe transport
MRRAIYPNHSPCGPVSLAAVIRARPAECARRWLPVWGFFWAAIAVLPTLAWADDQDTGPANAAAAREAPQVVVIGNAPLPGLGLPLNEVPANVQTGNSADMQRQQTLDLGDYLNNNFSGVNASESADNPYQMDIYYHGFTASPLLGTPEGLSVYVDGVRVNESFGDTVNWDLIPESAIANVTLMSGSNPVFGLNTLGGALSVQTKSGHENPGTELEGYGGSFGRRAFEGETGGESGPFDYFFTANYFDETGWRDLSPTRVYQGFGKVGWQNDKTDIDLSYTYADTDLYGDGATPMSMLDYRRASTYTPDITDNHLNFLNLTGTQFLTDRLLLSGDAYYRRLVTDAINGNINDSYLEPLTGPPIGCGLPLTTRAAIAYCTPGQNATTLTTQRSAGFGAQLTDTQNLLGLKNQAVVGVSYDDARDGFAQAFQYGGVAPPPDHALVYYDSPLNNETVISLSGSNRIFGLYFTDTLSPNDLLHLTASVRYTSNTETLDGYSIDTDPGDLGMGFDEPSAVTGDHTFSRVNPAFGFTLTPTSSLTFYADYNEASRAPTVIELGCANPAAPCGLPNDFASDPDLKQVVARTAEVGARGTPADQHLTWSMDVFRTANSDDIQFIASAINAGYFDNVGSTRRQGFDAAIGGKEGDFTWRAAYSFVDATFQSSFEVNAESNSTADANGNILVTPGDRIPLVPRSTARLVLDYDVSQSLNVGANIIYVSGSYLHGNENNANQTGVTDAATGQFIEGSGWLPGYTLVNLRTTYHISKHAELFARIVNVLNVDYATDGFLTSNSFNPNGTLRYNPNDWTNENAVSPGAPRGIWAGVRLRF